MIGGGKQKTDGESGIKRIESLVSEFQGLRGGMSIFQNDISLFDSTCLRDSIPEWDSRTSPCVTKDVIIQKRPAWQHAGDTCKPHPWRVPRVYVRAHTFAVTLPAHHLGPVHWPSLMRGLDLMHCCGTLNAGAYRPLLLLAFIWKTLQREGRAVKLGAQQGLLMSHA